VLVTMIARITSICCNVSIGADAPGSASAQMPLDFQFIN
jgi:hypothetical protein